MDMALVLFLCGDVMLGRGVDQILPHSVEPTLYEPYVKSAQRYVDLAEEAHGQIDQPVDYEYVWGDALAALKRVEPTYRIINLETAVTTADRPWPNKSIHYRMHPKNVKVLSEAQVDCAVLANNHTLDWGLGGLRQTVGVLEEASIKPVGAGNDAEAASAPVTLTATDQPDVKVFAWGMAGGGVYPTWDAEPERAGVNYLADLNEQSTQQVIDTITSQSEPDDIIVLSIHWGGNWGYTIPDEQQRFAHRVIDEAGVDILFGHSSHHVKGFEVYNDRLVLYGCGDFLNDYEGIGGREKYRGDLVLMYFPTLDPKTGRLTDLRMTPMRIRNMRLNKADDKQTRWLRDRLNREGKPFDVQVSIGEDGDLHLDRQPSKTPQCVKSAENPCKTPPPRLNA